MSRLAPLALAAALFGCALALVTSQYRARMLFAAVESAQQEAKSLRADQARLASDLGRMAQPASVESAAHRLGMQPIGPDRTVVLPVPAPALAAADDAARRSR